MYKKILQKSNIFRTQIVKILILASALLLNGCATPIKPLDLGIEENTWNNYDKNQKKELIERYQQLELANKAANEAVQQTVLAQQQGLSNERPYEAIEVKISSGTAFMPPFTEHNWQAFAPVTFVITAGACQDTWLEQLDGQNRIALRGCYKNKILRLDPSHYELDKQYGTISIPYSPLWDRGFTYHGINSDGYAKLKNASVSVRQVQ